MTSKNRFLARFLASTLLLGTISAATEARSEGSLRPKVVYGADDRIDVRDETDPFWLERADSTVALFNKKSVVRSKNRKRYALRTGPMIYDGMLCPDEPFADQEAGAFCSGALVGRDLVMTAGHCIETKKQCKTTRIVFGFALREDGQTSVPSVSASEVYSCKKIVSRSLAGEEDYALIRLDRAVSGHRPLAIRRDGRIEDDAPLAVIGHPVGLPAKIAKGARVVSNDARGYFTANLDTYGGNSGSPVFHAETGKIEGILVRGAEDFQYDEAGGCVRSNVISDPSMGEDATRVDFLRGEIPLSPSDL